MSDKNSILYRGKILRFSSDPNAVRDIIDSLPYDEKKYIGTRVGKNFSEEYISKIKNLKYREVLYVDNKPVSFIDVVTIPEEMDETDGFIIIATRDDHRYRHYGYGRILVNRLIEAMKRGKLFKRLIWEYDKGNNVSASMGKSLGFEGDSERTIMVFESVEDVETIYEDGNEKKTKSVKRVKLTESVLNQYKETSPFLRHVRMSDSSKGIVYVDDSAVVGVVNTETKANNQVWIQAFEVQKDHRKSGLGSKLLKWAMNQGKAEFLSVRKTNKVALEMYKKAGFRVYKETKSQYFMTTSNSGDFKESVEDEFFEDGLISDAVRRAIVRREAIRNNVLNSSTVYLYHGATEKFDLLKTVTPSFGNILEKPKMSIFCWMDKEKAIRWAVFKAIRRNLKQVMGNQRRVFYDATKEIKSTVMGKSEYNVLINELNSHPMFAYVYTLMVSVEDVGIGNDSMHDEYTIYECIKPAFVETIQINKDNIRDFINVYEDSDCDVLMNNYTRYVASKRSNILFNALMINDYTYQHITNRDLISTSFNKNPPESDADLEEYLRENNLKIRKIYPLRRLGEAIKYRFNAAKLKDIKPINEDKEENSWEDLDEDKYFTEDCQIIEDDDGEGLIVEACKDVTTARKFVAEVAKLAKKYNANYFIVTDGASGTHNDGNKAVEHARNCHKEWERKHGFDPDEDWRNEITESGEDDFLKIEELCQFIESVE